MKKIILSVLVLGLFVAPIFVFAATFNTELKFGSKGNEVKALQQELIKQGFLKGKPTSYFGNDTKNALIKYQKKNNLGQTGKADKATRDKLNKTVVSVVTKVNVPILKTLSNAEIIEKLKPSVVYIETSDAAGSGFVINSKGYILTNAHVVQGVTSANIIFYDDSQFTATVVGRDEEIDIALLKVNASNLKAVTPGNSDLVKQGDNVFTLGYPFGIKGDVSFKEGTISRRLKDGGSEYLETSAEIHPGNSGGPLVDKYGQVIGINSAGLGQSIQGVTVGETIKLAIPMNVAKNIIVDLINGRNVVKNIKPVVPVTTPVIKKTCNGNLSDLIFVDNKYKMYSLFDHDTYITMESNDYMIYGVIKNKSICSVSNIIIKVVIQDDNNLDLKQEESRLVFPYAEDSIFQETISPGGTGQYKAKLSAYDAFVQNEYTYGTLTSKKLKNSVKSTVQIIKADWR